MDKSTGPCQGQGAQWWASKGTPMTVLFWAPLLLLSPALRIAEDGLGVPAWLALGAIVAVCAAAVLAQHSRRLVERRVPEMLIAAQALVTLVVSAVYPADWSALYPVLAISVGAALRWAWTPLVIMLVAAVGAAMVLYHGGTWGEAIWGCALTSFLAGFGTFAFHRLFAVIAELNRTRDELARVAVSEERLRFSRDLHDLLGHTLSVIVVKAEAARRLVPRAPDAAVQHAADIEEIGRQALLDVRAAVSGYRGGSLAVELDRARTALTAAGISVSASSDQAGLPSEVDNLLGWVVREGATNVIRHSGARQCRIQLSTGAGRVSLELTDDGSGGKSAAAAGTTASTARNGSGSGLVGLRERVGALGGSLEAGPADPGFRLAVDVPVPAS